VALYHLPITIWLMLAIRLTITAAIVASLSCKSQSVPPHLIDPGATPHPEYPQSDYICALGIHSAEATDSTDSTDSTAASDKARAAVASQIQSSIKSEFLRYDAQAIKRATGSASQTSESRSEATIAINSTFEHNELIRIVDSTTGATESRALACLNRSEASQTLSETVGANLLRHNAAFKRAQAAFESGSLQSFASAHLEAKEVESTATPTLIQIRTLLARTPAEHSTIMSNQQTLDKWSATLRSESKLCLTGQDSNGAFITEAALKSLARLGFSAKASQHCPATACTVSMAMAFNDGCPARRNSIGLWVCQPTVTIELRSCSSGDSMANVTVQDKTLNGSGNRVELAKKQARSRVKSTRFDAPLSKSIASVLPTP